MGNVRGRSNLGTWVAGLLVLSLRIPAIAGITDCQGLCGAANPCTIAGNQVKDVEPGAVLDCSDRSITIANGRIEVTNGAFVLKAVRLTVNPSNSIEAKCTMAGRRPGFSLVLSEKLELWGFLQADCDFGGGAVRVRATGDVNVYDTGGAQDGKGVFANGTLIGAEGGRVSLVSETGSVVLGDPVQADAKEGFASAAGGTIDVEAPAGNITVAAPLVATGRQDRGGSINLEAGGDLTVADRIEADGRNQHGDGGDVHLGAGDALAVYAVVSAQGGLDSGGGQATGGAINLEAGLGGVAINAALDATSGAGGPGGDGGAVVVQSLGSVAVAAGVSLLTRSDANGGDGGGISLVSHGARRCSGNNSLKCDSDGECAGAGVCQVIGGQLTIGSAATLDARGHTGQGAQGAGAGVELRGCGVSVASGAVIHASGYDGGAVTMTGRGALTVDGTVTATGTNANGVIRLVTPPGTTPSIGGQLNPAPQLGGDGIHPCS